ncbi:MAG: DUF2066 domain-containing protein [Gammaproteobacteria bacterium]|nr:DUF2066 domain-containing protein [Gammaproteobacteria bacterium]
MLYRCFYPLLALVVLLSLPLSRADVVADMYEATIPVKSQDRQARDDAIRAALVEVLTRVSGRSQIGESEEYPRIKASLVNATNYAQQFRYREATPAGAAGADGNNLELWVKFDPVVVNKLLRENNIPVWDKTRPSTLVWLVSDEHARRDVIGQASDNPLRLALEQRAQRRGLPIRLPQMDLNDRNTIQINDVWVNNDVAIRQASQHYPSDAILVGRLLLLPNGQWNANWTLYHEGRKLDWAVNNVDLEAAVGLGVDKTAEALAQRYAQLVQGEDSVVLVQVKGIHTLTDFNRSVKYLRSLSQVKSVSPQWVQADMAIFRVTTQGGRLGLARAVSLSEIFSAEVQDTTAAASPSPTPIGASQIATPTPELTYRLVP